MADIFISYSKQDRALALTLSTYLEAEGWTVWWDRSLTPGDEFRDEIMNQLATSRAVIVIWTTNSVNSKWVRAEAGVADRAKKLIPTKTSSLLHGDIPLPFCEQHTEDVSDTEVIRAAVVALLAKPSIRMTELQRAYAAVCNDLLKWSGIIGGTLTLYAHAGAAFGLSYWAHFIVEHWSTIIHSLWTYPFSLLDIKIPKEISLALTLLVSLFAIAIGERKRSGLRPELELPRKQRDELIAKLEHRYRYSSLHPLEARKKKKLIKGAEQRYDDKKSEAMLRLIPLLAIFSAMVLWPVYNELLNELLSHHYGNPILRIKLLLLIPVGLLSLGPLRPIVRRLSFAIIGCLILMTLNEVWILGSGYAVLPPRLPVAPQSAPAVTSPPASSVASSDTPQTTLPFSPQDASAMFNLGKSYERVDGVAQDYGKLGR